ncbi:pyruvate/2-oxoglutarate/acetoin dehydrogenase E1 component/TPP-dependent pyruvate/acetoin dehydrogenase alpha subunit [Pedobacter cryoconitis]|uniref:3-methyl-2-oxobutanoate dehydrogenase (2-methylpropanoyl-transferring) n=1 Tax=Pedobacter cryoconitis TaxID=188932 RepID=A0A7W9DKA1_9SPHI|nr:alpha-ketoacid dehydrogenase subunit alpha/beta [Pedobacter cryoconitis]MBB5621938.1 pyruvate/2-oxoglutarate/acetoin dehydrogenase E1 component/TPP-dependent pyruvate/acetoin dehydrogenase alpha subunit [Pedobacter cryoconitis]MBB5643961.1 pyruvate/2-oxoglutarate/acetoin dehydrogenase E1 component/TPP-dependent pyruvate/acetoin dehydrogenase alpha subunit [Pedobacter cryoconitis]
MMLNNKLTTNPIDASELSFDDFKTIVIDDYRIAFESRQASLLGRKEVLTGKAKFGIFGDGKELPQIAMAKAFKNGDWRSGYYRDQTFAFATGICTIKEFFAQLYANPSVEADPASAGRQMNCHFSTRSLNEDGSWKNLTEMKNSSSDIAPTGGQMARLVGLAYASKLYRQNPELNYLKNFSVNGNEVGFGTIGNASTSEGVFFEAINAAGVLQIPMAMSVWDDAYGISVPAKYQTTKEDISEILKGFQRDENNAGYEIYKVRGWDYPALCETYQQAIQICREEHVPVLIHVTEVTQPQGHSTSGSHERYKDKARLEWEKEFDCIRQMRLWMLESAIVTEEELAVLEDTAKKLVREAQKEAWNEFLGDIKTEKDQVISLINNLSDSNQALSKIAGTLGGTPDAQRKEVISSARKALRLTLSQPSEARNQLLSWYQKEKENNEERYNSKLFTDGKESPSLVNIVPASYQDNSKMVDGRELLNACFDANFARDQRLVAFGEDLGNIGDVNQGFAGLQAKYGELRITDTGIREMTIAGQGIGLALRGLRPIAEIQYLDYLLYALNVLSDDLASLSYRTKGGQKAPVIIRTRGHRLEGVWHSGSPIGMILGSLRGLHLCVPRNMTQAAGMYNTLFRADEPALMIECLNGYRLKEMLPDNVGEYTVPLGKAEIVREGTDITVVSYGSTLRIVEEAAEELAAYGISVEIIDPQTLLPFDTDHLCASSLQKTNKLLVVDEDVPGGGTAYILQQILENQGGYYHLDAQPQTLSAKAHRPPYGSDGDYFTKPSVDDVVETIYQMMHAHNEAKYPAIF